MTDIIPSLASPPWTMENQEGGAPPSIGSVPVILINDVQHHGIAAFVEPDGLEANSTYLCEVSCLSLTNGQVHVQLAQSFFTITAPGFYSEELTTPANISGFVLQLTSGGDAYNGVFTKPKLTKIS